MPADKYVIVHRSYDPLQADMLGDILRDSGIAARVLGTRHGAIIGVGQTILQVHIEVPQSQAGQATDFLEDFFANRGAELSPDDDLGEEGQEEHAKQPGGGDEPRERALRPLFAAGLSLLLGIGMAHLYGRRPWTALVIAAGQLAVLARLATAATWPALAAAMVTCAGLVVIELIGSQRAVRAWNRGVRVQPLGQLVRGAVLVIAAGAAGALLGPHVPQPARAASEWPEPERQLHQPSMREGPLGLGAE